MKRYVPTLSTNNWIADPKLAMESIFLRYLVMRKTDSNFNYRKMRSLSYTLSRIKDPLDLTDKIREELEDLYEPYYHTYTVDTGFTTSIETGVSDIHIEVVVVVQGVTYKLAKVLEEKDSAIRNLDKIITSIRR